MKLRYHIIYPTLDYYQNDSNSFYFSNLASAFTASGESNSAMDIVMRIEESLNFQSRGYKDIISFDNAIMKYHVRNMGKKSLPYNIKQ